MIMSAALKSKFGAFNRQWWRLQVRLKFSIRTSPKNPQTNTKKKYTKKWKKSNCIDWNHYGSIDDVHRFTVCVGKAQSFDFSTCKISNTIK